MNFPGTIYCNKCGSDEAGIEHKIDNDMGKLVERYYFMCDGCSADDWSSFPKRLFICIDWKQTSVIGMRMFFEYTVASGLRYIAEHERG